MDVTEAIQRRRSAKRFTDRPVARDVLERLLEAAVLPPNHKMTEPWAFHVLGPQTQRRYAELKGEMKSRRVDDAAAAAAVREKVLGETLAVPCVLAVTCAQDDDPMTREEDAASCWMGVQNLLLAAGSAGLAGYIHTGRILNRPELREALEVPEHRLVLALLDLGEPAELPAPKPRVPAAERTKWLP